MKILVICSGGMSTSLLVNSMKKTAQAEKNEITIEAGSIAELSKKINNCDVVMIAPQIRHRMKEIQTITDRAGKTAVAIEPQVYGLIDGRGALKQAMDAVK